MSARILLLYCIESSSSIQGESSVGQGLANDRRTYSSQTLYLGFRDHGSTLYPVVEERQIGQ